ncbi:hypothetical protein OROHE_005779 [Orobanche hederae]
MQFPRVSSVSSLHIASFTPRILESNAVTTKGEQEGMATQGVVVAPAAEGENVQSAEGEKVQSGVVYVVSYKPGDD